MEEDGVRSEVPGYAKVCGILSLIFAVVSFLIPIIGVLYITPFAIILGALALHGGYKSMGIATLIVVVVNLMISPSFWASVGGGATFEEASGNRFLTYFDVLGVIGMLFLVVRKRAEPVAPVIVQTQTARKTSYQANAAIPADEWTCICGALNTSSDSPCYKCNRISTVDY